MDDGLARRELGFEARTPLDEGLRRTLAWYRGKPARARLRTGPRKRL